MCLIDFNDIILKYITAFKADMIYVLQRKKFTLIRCSAGLHMEVGMRFLRIYFLYFHLFDHIFFDGAAPGNNFSLNKFGAS